MEFLIGKTAIAMIQNAAALLGGGFFAQKTLSGTYAGECRENADELEEPFLPRVGFLCRLTTQNFVETNGWLSSYFRWCHEQEI